MNDYRVTNDKVIFWGSFLSNWYPCKITYEGHQFKSSEQLFMWMKAKYFKDDKIADEILKCSSPKEAKKLGRKVRGFNQDSWDKVKLKCMYNAIYNKFEQNPKLKSKFLELGDGRNFVEGSPYDTVWGIGIDWRDVRAELEPLWKGQNLLGEVLDNLRIDYLLSIESEHEIPDIFKIEQ